MDIDYALCVDLLGLNGNQFKLSQSIPPHTLTAWSGPNPQPTEAECAEVWSAYIAAEPIRLLRVERDKLLTESDWTGLSDSALTNEVAAKWKLYRQKLRDLPAGLNTPAKVKAAKWPTKPA